MIQSVTLKAEDLQQAAPASEITCKYENLSKTAKELYEKQKETVEGHEAFIDAGNDFGQWIRVAKERLSKCAEPTGDKEALSTKLNQLKTGIVKWTEYEDQYADAVEWLSQTEEMVQSFNKLQDSLEQKRITLELFQSHLQTLFEWQQQLDNLNLKAQVSECSEIPATLSELNCRLGVVKGIQQSLEQGQNRLRYALELKEKVILNTEQNGAAKIQEDSESLKQEFDKLIIDVQIAKHVNKLEDEVKDYDKYRNAQMNAVDWLRKTRISIQQCSDSHGEKNEIQQKQNKLREIENTVPQGKLWNLDYLLP
ncbi:hypothetical protein AAG570_006448 [Ranatra chinensis]|uniref:Uncharacterized protein n=1 Tax=Ranatra chinensis TaxID=642074 RepID=A0ABD0YU11_9HEMI